MTTMTPDANFWTKIARKYAAQAIGNPEGYQNTLERTKSHLKPTDSALEIGCGTGSTALLLAPHVAHITATDLAPGMIEIAQEKLTEEPLDNVTFKVAEVLDHAPADGPYDVVMAHNLLHLVPNLSRALKRIHDLTEPGGLFISKTVCAPRNAGFKFALMRRVAIPLMQLIGKAPYVEFMPAETLEAQIENAGFQIIETGDQPGMVLSRYIVARKI